MSKLENTDLFLINRSDTTSTIIADNLMADLLDDDLMLINRANVTSTITGAEIKDSLKAKEINPTPSEITSNPAFQGGTGTDIDPYILQTQECAPAGASLVSIEQITIAPAGAVAGEIVEWTSDNSRFDQILGVTDANGEWIGRLAYNDIPDTTVDQDYTGNLQIGSAYFRWTVEQKVLSQSPPDLTNVSLVESNPEKDDRFTSQSFVASAQVTEGEPLSDKTFVAHVDGTLSKTVKFEEPLVSSAFDGSGKWNIVPPAEINSWTDVTYGNGKFVAVAENGINRVMYSDDGTSWTKASPFNEDNAWQSVAYGNGRFVAGGNSGTNPVMYSDDAISWYYGSIPQAFGWHSITYGELSNGTKRYVAVSGTGTNRVAYSDDGINWIATASAEEGTGWHSVTYGNGRFVAVAHTSLSDNWSPVMYSDDGISWTATASEISSDIDVYGWVSVTYGDDKFVAVSYIDGYTMHSDDGINWTLVQSYEKNMLWRSVTYGDNKFLAVSNSGLHRVKYSADGINWSYAAEGGSDSSWFSVTYGDGKFVAAATDGTNRVMWSTTGRGEVKTLTFANDADMEGLAGGDTVNQTYGFTASPESSITDLTGAWNPVPTSYALDMFYSVAYGADKFIATNRNGMVSSPDGTNWTDIVGAPKHWWRDLIYANGRFVGCGGSRFIHSTDGINWTENPNVSHQAVSVAYGELADGTKRFVAIAPGNNPLIAYSDGGDAYTWIISRAHMSTNAWSSITFGDGKFVAVANSGDLNRAMYSTDGLLWTEVTPPVPNTWESVTYGNGMFVAVGGNYNFDGKSVMYSTDAIHWEITLAAEHNHWTDVTYGDGRFVAVAQDGINRVMYSADGINWTTAQTPESNGWYSVTYGDDRFVAVAYSGDSRTMWSLDGTGASAELTFPADTDMTKLSVDDNVSQTYDFAEPLESAVDNSFVEDWVAGWSAAWYQDYNAIKIFDGNPNTYAYVGNGNSAITWTLQDGNGNGFTLTGKLGIYCPNDTAGNASCSITVQYDGGKQFIGTFVGPGFFECPYLERINYLNFGTGPYGAQITYMTLNGEEIITDQPIFDVDLVFPSGTDMTKLSVNDTVSQTYDFIEPLENSVQFPAENYSADVQGVPVIGTIDNMFDGNTSAVMWGAAPQIFYFNCGDYNFNGSVKVWCPVQQGQMTVDMFVGPSDTTLTTTYTADLGDGNSGFEIANTQGKPINQIRFRHLAGGNVQVSQIAINDKILINADGYVDLTFADGTDMAALEVGNTVSQAASGETGTVASVINTTVSVNGSSGTWSNGNDVSMLNKTVSGTVDSIENTTINLSDQTGNFVAGNDVTAGNKTVTGTVRSIENTTANLSNLSGNFVAGNDVTTGDKTTSGVVSGTSGTTANLSSSTGTFVPGPNVTGPQKTIVEDNTRLYCAFDSNGNINNLQNKPQDPPYTTTDTNPNLTLTFPATFPSGQTPDDELPEGTTLTVEVTAENDAGTSGPLSATVQPEVVPDPTEAALGGLITLYTGDGNLQTITSGINLADNGGLVWTKARKVKYNHALNDSSTNFTKQLNTAGTSGGSNAPITVTSTGHITNGSTVDGQAGNDYVAWTFGKAPGYFDVVQYNGTGTPKAIPHNLGTKPGMIIVKIVSESDQWRVYHSSQGAGYFGTLNASAAFQGPASAYWNNTEPTDTEFTVGTDSSVNFINHQFVAYLFAEDTPGVIKCGADNTTVNDVVTGFKPQFVLTKVVDGDADWDIVDAKRPQFDGLKPNLQNVEERVEILLRSDGFKIMDSKYVAKNYIYVAIAEPPIARSQTAAEFAETQLKMLSYKNRREVVCGQMAAAERDDLIATLVAEGYTLSEVLEFL